MEGDGSAGFDRLKEDDDGVVEADRLKAAFRVLNRCMLLAWRLGFGPALNVWPSVGGRIMVLGHTGRRSGLTRRTPLNYALIDGDVLCTAGFGSRTDWYRNVIADPVVEVWLPGARWSGLAEDVTDHPGSLGLMRQVLIGSGFAAWVAGIHPRTDGDQELAATTAGYRLVRIRRTADLTGSGGPGDLRWAWAVAVPVIAWLRRRLRRHRASQKVSSIPPAR
jgi:deazaflavin-dependent oxidoreductase (nitroreductase family)